MNFCNNCGVDLRQHFGAKFCFNCGNSIENDSAASSIEISYSNSGEFNTSIQLTNTLGKTKFENGFKSYGIILTNLTLLADKLNCGEADIELVILDYVSKIKDSGHQYVLLDTNNNSYKNLTADDGWQSHVELLKDFHKDNSQAQYLFIIGGNDVVPMAIIDNEPRCYEDDHEIDTDMPYSYLLNSNFEELLWNGSIFKKDVHLYSGRLPVSSDLNIDNIKTYLYNSSNVISDGIDTENCFGMTAKSWEKASSTIIKKIQLNKKLHTSPDHDLDSAKEIFNTRADIYYFNLHGSDSPSSPEFFGDQAAVICPDYLSDAEKLNFLFTEACYGAKFIDYETNECMLLTTLFNKTVAYVGSSKVAFGASSENISSADVVAKSFLENILSGNPCGLAMSLARVDVFDSCPNDQYDYGTTSAAEFNLFGDPICSVYSSSKRKSSHLTSTKIWSKSFNNSRPEKKEINIDSIEKGILNDVRNLVNKEILKIREVVNRELYSQFNIEPRNLSTVFEIKGKYGDIIYNYNYFKNSVSGKKQVFSVFADRTGKIKSILQSK